MKFPIALQLYSVCDDMAAGFESALNRLKESGCGGVASFGFLGKTAAEVKKLCEGMGLIPISADIPFVDMMSDTHLLYTYAKSGLKFAVVIYLAEENESISRKSDSPGTKSACRNRNLELLKFDGEYAYDGYYWNVCVCTSSENSDLK